MTPELADRIYDEVRRVGFWLLVVLVLTVVALHLIACQTPPIIEPGGVPVDPCGEYGTGTKCKDGACCPVEGSVCSVDDRSCPGVDMCCAGAGSQDWPFGSRRKPTKAIRP